MFERWHTYKPFQNWKKNTAGFISILICNLLFSAGDYGLEIDYNKGLPSTVTRKTYIDKDGTVWVGTDAGLGVFPKTNTTKVAISKAVGFSQVWDIVQKNNLLYVGCYDSGLYIFNYNTGTLLKRFQSTEYPRIRKIKSINNRLFLVAGNGFFEISGLKIQCLIDKHPIKIKGKSMPMDMFYFNQKYYVSYYQNQPLVTWENENRWKIDLNDPLNKLLYQKGKFKSVMTSIVFQNKLYGSTGDNAYFSIDQNGKSEIFSFNHQNNDNYVVWDFIATGNKLMMAVGNTNNFESGYLYTHNDLQKTFDIGKQQRNPFYWSITYDKINHGIWANSINKGVYYFPQFENNVILPFDVEDYIESDNFQFAWKSNKLIYKNKQGVKWETFLAETNIRLVQAFKEYIILHCENGIFIFKHNQKNKVKHIFNLAFEHVFIQNDLLYCVNYFGPIWSYDLVKEKVINQLDQSIENFNSVSYTKQFAILHSDNLGYFILQNDSLHKLKIDIPIDKSKFNFFLAGNALLIQDGQKLICFEIDFYQKKLNTKEVLYLSKLFPAFEITWMKGNDNGLWLGNNQYAMQFGINPESQIIKFINQFYLGNSKEINQIHIDKDYIYLLRTNFIQKIIFKDYSKMNQKFSSDFQKKENISNFKLPYYNQGENFPIHLNSSNYIQNNHSICEIILSNNDSIIGQNFRETRLPIWMNDLNEGLFQITINTIQWKQGIPIKIENPVLKRIEFWILVIIAVFIFFFFLYNEQYEKFQLQEQILGLELSRLKSNMNPHFIFNVMNFVQAMIVKNNKIMAIKATTKLSQINRLFLETSEKDAISLKQELEFVNTYIQLEKMRFESDKEFEFVVFVEEGLRVENWELPPLILQPLLENALKHGVLLEKNSIGYIGIHITSSSPNEIIIQIRNKGLTSAVERKAGTSSGQKMVIDRISLFNKKFKKTYNIHFSTSFEDTYYNCFILISKIAIN